MHLPVIETGALPWKGNMLPLHQRCFRYVRNLSHLLDNRLSLRFFYSTIFVTASHAFGKNKNVNAIVIIFNFYTIKY
tara:strand:- start:21 stop:251 length:231 start_codon:yes stop_codon:yes gene_type:complete